MAPHYTIYCSIPICENSAHSALCTFCTYYHILRCVINEHTNCEGVKLLYIENTQGASSWLGRLQLLQHVKLSLCVYLVLTLSFLLPSFAVICHSTFSSLALSCTLLLFPLHLLPWLSLNTNFYSMPHLCLKWLKACLSSSFSLYLLPFLPPSSSLSICPSLCVRRKNNYTLFHSFIPSSHFVCVTAQIHRTIQEVKSVVEKEIRIKGQIYTWHM